jgi:ATP synthase I subunit
VNAPEVADSHPDAEHFYSGAVGRIVRVFLVFGVLCLPLVGWKYGFTTGIGFTAGGLVSWMNFAWLARGVAGLTGRIVNDQSAERGGAVMLRFLLRYALVGIVAYAIFKGSFQAFRGFLFGLCLPVAGMLGEAAYEAHAAFRRGY